MTLSTAIDINKAQQRMVRDATLLGFYFLLKSSKYLAK